MEELRVYAVMKRRIPCVARSVSARDMNGPTACLCFRQGPVAGGSLTELARRSP